MEIFEKGRKYLNKFFLVQKATAVLIKSQEEFPGSFPWCWTSYQGAYSSRNNKNAHNKGIKKHPASAEGVRV